jgi:sensor histidine kinase YesM
VKKILTSIWLLGLVIAVPIILSLPGLFKKYKISLVLQETAAQPMDYRIFFRDLDGNGIKQKIYAFPNHAGQLAIQYFGDNVGMINQINFSHKFTPVLSFLYFGDANNNGKLEVYGFTMDHDSLYLNWTEPFQSGSNISESLFISRIGTFDNGKMNFSINRFGVGDIEHDGNNEIIFSITSGYSKFPRIMVMYHPDTGKLIKSKDAGINPLSMSFYDLNHDGVTEILAGSSAGYNLTDSTSTLYKDNRPYLVAYDKDLNMFFPPVPFPSGINNNIQFFVDSTDRKEILVFQFNRSLASKKIIKIYSVDFSGNMKDSVFLPEYGKNFAFQVFPFGGNFWLYTGDKMVKLNNKLKIAGVKDIAISVMMYPNPVFVKGNPEFATRDMLTKKACFYTENFNHKVEKDYGDETIKNIILDIGKGADYFMVQTNLNEYTYHFQKNWLYYVKFLVYFLIYLLSVLFVWLTQRIREKQLVERYELQNQLRDVEIKYLRMQMDPHFMFNAFTTMALMIKSGDRNEAFDSFMKFTRMLRSNFDFSDFLTRPLKEELQTVTDYLEINKLRFKDKLDFEVIVEEDVPVNSLIPKMMLQIHVENSLKHGLSQLDKTGLIRIGVYKSGEFIYLSVEDNGIGRQKAASLNRPSTKQGIKMLQALMERLNLQNKLKITQIYTDLADDQGNPAGTRVDIQVPLNLKE